MINALIRNNTIEGAATGIRVRNASSGEIVGNRVTASLTSFDLDAAFSGFVRQNRFQGAQVGVRYEFPASLSDNDIANNQTGVIAVVNSESDGLGMQPGTIGNRIFANQIGVQLTGRMQRQRIYQNATGVAGTGNLVSSSLDTANWIESNGVGVDLTGRIEFQRIARNTVGIAAFNSQLIAHNLIYRNTTGINVVGRTDVRIIGNTLYTPVGTLLQVSGGSRQVEVQNNIFWTEDGYNLHIANDSTVGFFSDYNVLHTSGNGKIAYWTKDFHDILDWQEDVFQFDLNSIGRTSVNPNWSEPRFINKALDDYRVYDQVARQRFTSPTIDAGNPLIDLALPTTQVNLLSNPGFENGLTGWNVAPSGATQSANPAPFAGTNYFNGGANPTTTLTQSINLLTSGFTASQLDTQDLALTFGGRVRSANEAAKDEGQITLIVRDGSNNILGAPRVVQSTRNTERWELIGGRFYLPTGARTVEFQYLATRRSGTTNDAYLDGAFVTVQASTTIADAGAYSLTTLDVAQRPHLVLRSPDLYKDWERDKPLSIRWDSFGNANEDPVVIDLYQDTAQGPQFVTRISTGTPDDGEFSWIAANNGINYGTYGLRIQLSLGTNATILDRSTETFTVPENTNTFFVNDGVLLGDEYVTAVGNNRNTGKLASIPKPYPNNVLRIYSLGANQTLSIDSGDYPLLYPLVVSNQLGIGDDEGFVMRGAVNGTTSLSHANPLTVAPMLELNDADFMALQNLEVEGGTKGIWIRNLSTDVTMSDIRSLNNSQEGILVDLGSQVLSMTGIESLGNVGNGIAVSGLLGSLSGSTISGNLQTGLFLNNAGPTQVFGNTISGNLGANSFGAVLIHNGTTPLVFGRQDLALQQGNLVFGNGRGGISLSGNVLVVGNTVYGHSGLNGVGITGGTSNSVLNNVVYGNRQGIFQQAGGLVIGNRVYNNTEYGISVSNSTAQRNVVYSNLVGIVSSNSILSNNLIYENLQTSLSVQGGTDVRILNNTIHQRGGNAIAFVGGSTNLQYRNNIVWSEGGVGMAISPSAQSTFAGDFNLYFGSANIANWGSIPVSSLSFLQSLTQSNFNSITGDPSFVNSRGADGIHGFVSLTQDGRDDDFHLKSLHGSFHGGSFAPVATSTERARHSF